MTKAKRIRYMGSEPSSVNVLSTPRPRSSTTKHETSTLASGITEAEELFNQALHLYSRIGDNVGRATVKWTLGHLYRVQGLNTRATPLLAEARSLYALIGNSEKEKSCSRWLDVLSKQGYSSSTSWK
ncbi:hypothetical protein M407DRAFT_25370 [Tulasnella calospora MUT 4182]|uniref:Uncharacterized protein n=1 Tax=Tulasnella calospora MUT 4182 TaxID=1051891 RepID=A0A0C3QG64_9AGAM|nr:hypothetical protein M407DRAFT_25370 [Tulasnella calospora MUT 4182]